MIYGAVILIVWLVVCILVILEGLSKIETKIKNIENKISNQVVKLNEIHSEILLANMPSLFTQQKQPFTVVTTLGPMGDGK